MERCIRCGKRLDGLDVALYKKLVNRGATQYTCTDCLCAHFRVSRELVMEKARHFQQQGCTLFAGMELGSPETNKEDVL